MDMVTVVMLLICPWLQKKEVQELRCDSVLVSQGRFIGCTALSRQSFTCYNKL